MVIRCKNRSAYGDSVDVIHLPRTKKPRPLSPYSHRMKLSHGESQDVIDLGGPKKPRAKPRAPYIPSTRLYPGPQAMHKKKSQDGESKLQRKKKMRQPRQLVPNPRLYQPRPRRVIPPPPPLWPAVSWQPPIPTGSLDTASGAALRLIESRKQSYQKLSKRRTPINKGMSSETRRTHKKKMPQQDFNAWQEENPFLRSVSVAPKASGKQPSWLSKPHVLGPYDDLI
ncbi:uncharacterized protein [Battus philenor]|uniref:uncharacterized protein n=1 Tax=Battus philenor TaxID=42288 RepID=UPI0035CFADB8